MKFNPFRKNKKEIEPEAELRSNNPCVFDDTISYSAPSVYFIQNHMPLIIIEDTHYHFLSEASSISITKQQDRLDGMGDAPNGVYTLSEFCTLKDFVKKNED